MILSHLKTVKGYFIVFLIACFLISIFNPLNGLQMGRILSYVSQQPEDIEKSELFILAFTFFWIVVIPAISKGLQFSMSEVIEHELETSIR